jgi:hypothetical protein
MGQLDSTAVQPHHGAAQELVHGGAHGGLLQRQAHVPPRRERPAGGRGTRTHTTHTHFVEVHFVEVSFALICAEAIITACNYIMHGAHLGASLAESTREKSSDWAASPAATFDWPTSRALRTNARRLAIWYGCKPAPPPPPPPPPTPPPSSSWMVVSTPSFSTRLPPAGSRTTPTSRTRRAARSPIVAAVVPVGVAAAAAAAISSSSSSGGDADVGVAAY